MKVFYKQNENNSVFDTAGIKNCRFKQLYHKSNNTKTHHHTEFEIHIISNGFQVYKTEDKEYHIKSGELLVIPPKIKHSCIESPDNILKYVITFECDSINGITDCVCLKTNNCIYDNISYILKESKQKFFFSPYLVQNRAFEIIITLLRMCGFNEAPTLEDNTEEDARLAIAKQYIQDNICLNLRVSDVAAYCYLSTKQLTRLFFECDNITPAVYIAVCKGKEAENLLTDSSLSLKEISETMNFSSEYHFNTFFKKHSGMPPGEFRKMKKE